MKSLFNFLIILFTSLSINAHADGRPLGAELVWTASEGTLDFQHELVKSPLYPHGPLSPSIMRIKSTNEEYFITLEWNNIWIEWKNGFESRKNKKMLYATVDFPFSTSSRFPIYVSLNSNNELIITPSDNGNVDYYDQIFSLLHVETNAHLLEVLNESAVEFEDTLSDGSLIITNGSRLESQSGKYALIFEDKGWVEFNPLTPKEELNPFREINIWLEIEEQTSKQMIKYATIKYDYRQGFVNENGVYRIDLPIQIIINSSGLLEISTLADINYLIGKLNLKP